jgi:hypothetical protein
VSEFDSGSLPPDIPPEYADAYRRGYQRAYRQSIGEADVPEPPQPGSELSAEATPAPSRGQAATSVPPVVHPDRQVGIDSIEEIFAAADEEPADDDQMFADAEAPPWQGPTHREPLVRAVRPGWFVPAILAVVAVLLVASAYGVGKLLSDLLAGSPQDKQGGVSLGAGGRHGTEPSRLAKRLTGARYAGPVSPADVAAASSNCVLPASTDAAGHPVGYEPTEAVDQDMSTAWRCAGDGRGVRLRLALGSLVRIGEVGLVAGYAKTDPRSHADRYAENNRITKVRWTFSNGRSTVQMLDGAADHRAMQTMRIPAVRTATVTMEVLASTPGPRDTVAVSEVDLGQAEE